MRLHRFYVTESIGSKKEISIHSDELANQLSRVFRLKTGDRVVLFDGSGFDYECVISGFLAKSGAGVPAAGKSDQKVVTFQIEKNTTSRFMPTREVILCAAVVKKDTFEWIVEKATELGVTKIIPVMAERSEKKNLNEDRLKKKQLRLVSKVAVGLFRRLHRSLILHSRLRWSQILTCPPSLFILKENRLQHI